MSVLANEEVGITFNLNLQVNVSIINKKSIDIERTYLNNL